MLELEQMAWSRLIRVRDARRPVVNFGLTRPNAFNRAASAAPGGDARISIRGVVMITLYHHPFCPHSRSVRLVFAEMGIAPKLVEERAWERRREFLLMAAEGATPLMVEENGFALPGAEVIAEYLDETRGLGLGDRRLLPEGPADRAETRRLIAWFNVKFFNEASQWLVREKIYKRFMSREQGGGGPDMEAVRAARSNLRYHLRYIGHLIKARNWLAGERMTYADLAAAAHLSCLDYLGDVQWDENETARLWYARVKSRPSFRPLLAERLPGTAPSASYADLDF
jgi:glutathione S-transferase